MSGLKVADGEFTHCPGCGGQIDLDDATAVKAVEIVSTGPNLKQTEGELIDRRGALFHPACLPERSSRWRRAESPAA